MLPEKAFKFELIILKFCDKIIYSVFSGGVSLEEYGSREIAVSAIKIALTETREEEAEFKKKMSSEGVRCCAVDFGGDFIGSVNKIVESTVVGAKREKLINTSHMEEGAVAGAAREAMAAIMTKAIGLNAGGKIGIARNGDHIAVCIFCGIGLLHLNEIAIGLGHRVI